MVYLFAGIFHCRYLRTGCNILDLVILHSFAIYYLEIENKLQIYIILEKKMLCMWHLIIYNFCKHDHNFPFFLSYCAGASVGIVYLCHKPLNQSVAIIMLVQERRWRKVKNCWTA